MAAREEEGRRRRPGEGGAAAARSDTGEEARGGGERWGFGCGDLEKLGHFILFIYEILVGLLDLKHQIRVIILDPSLMRLTHQRRVKNLKPPLMTDSSEAVQKVNRH